MRTAAFALECEEREDVPVLMIGGDLDLETAPGARRLLEEILERSPQDLVFDFSELRYLDSSGLGVILLARRRVPGKVTVIGSTPAVRKALFLSGLNEMVIIQGDASDEESREASS